MYKPDMKMRAIVLTYDKNALLTEHMISCYKDLWPDHPFVFRIPFQSEERCIVSPDREYIHTSPEIKMTVLTLLCDLHDEEWVYWCIDDKYPIKLQISQISSIYDSILREPSKDISGVLFCRARHMMDPDYLTPDKIYLGNEQLLGRKAYQQIWIHQFIRVKVLRHLFSGFPDFIPKASMMDGMKDRLVKLEIYKIYVTAENHAVFGESSIGNVITGNCISSLIKKGFQVPSWHEIDLTVNTIIGIL